MAAATSAFAILASAQSISSSTSLAPAATTVASSVSAALDLFPAESIQLTDAILADVTSILDNVNISSLFAFESNSSLTKRSHPSCKLMPGDALWPSDRIWDIFDILLGRRLIKAAPLAAVCYPSWPEYDADSCSTITANWLLSNLQ
jgi:hypothetical protein